MNSAKNIQIVPIQNEYAFSFTKKLFIIVLSIFLNAVLVWGFVSYFGKTADQDEEPPAYSDTSLWASINLLQILATDKKTIPYSAFVNLTLMSTCALFAWFFLQSEVDNATLSLTVEKLKEDHKALATVYGRLSPIASKFSADPKNTTEQPATSTAN